MLKGELTIMCGFMMGRHDSPASHSLPGLISEIDVGQTLVTRLDRVW